MIVCDEGTPQGAYTAKLEWVENEGVSKSTLVSSSLSRSVHQGEYCKKGEPRVQETCEKTNSGQATITF